MNSLSHDIHALMGCRSLQELLDTARRIVGNPLILADLTCHVLAMTEDESVADPRWIEITRERTVPSNILNIGLYQSALRSDAPVMTTDSTGLSTVRCAVGQDGRLVGYLMSPCYNSAPTQEHLDLIRLLGDLCMLRMQKDLHYGEYPENMLEFFLADLLEGVITDEQRILDRSRFFHWNLQTPYRVMTIRPAGSGMAAGGDYLTLDRHRDALHRLFPDATVFLYGCQIKMITPVYDHSTKDSMILHDLREICSGRGLIAGVSQSSRRLRNLSSRNQQAMKALEMGTLLRGTGPLFLYDSYSIYHCLEICASRMDLVQLCHSAVLRLESYDRKNGTELLGSLHAYLSCHRNLSEAAAALFVHRNTLSKRLEKINDLIHVDFSDAETVFHLMFSYRIIEYYGATVLRNSYESWVERAPTLRHP